MQLKNRSFIFSGLIASALLATVACKKDNHSNTPPPATAPKVQVTSNTKFGNILTDSAGRTLYFFSNDANGSSSCYGACAVLWPVFHASASTISTGLNASDFATITRTDGTLQTTYKGWPLYYYQPDMNPGDVNGDPVGNVWFVAKPDYTVMLANAQLLGNDGVQYTNLYIPGTGLTKYITDDYGRTLYTFSHDSTGKNKYTKADFSNNATWPIDTLSTIANVPSILVKSNFSTINVFGRVQLTYKGWPMYYFGPDSLKRGNNKGISVPTPRTWPIANDTTAGAPM